jgi:hypothetical protein
LFIQRFAPGNRLAPPPHGYQQLAYSGDECNAVWDAPNTTVNADDLDGFDFASPNHAIQGVYFSLAPGSPTLTTYGFGPGDILYTEVGLGSIQRATLQGGIPATAANLGIAGEDIDGLNVYKDRESEGVILAGAVGDTPNCYVGVVSTHLVEFTVAPRTGSPFGPADILVRTGAGTAEVHTSAGALGLQGSEDNVNALEARACRMGGGGGGEDVVPPVETPAVGQIIAELDADEGMLEIMVWHTVEHATGARIHQGPPGQNGPLVFDLGYAASPLYVTLPLSLPQMDSLFAGELYLTIGSLDHQAGEVRVQIGQAGFDDWDGDGVVDELDVCPQVGVPGLVDEFGRPKVDSDEDGDVDLADYHGFQLVFTGPLVP